MADAPSLGTFSYDDKKDIKQDAPVDPRPIHLWPFGQKDTVAAPVAAPTPAPSVSDVSGGLVKPPQELNIFERGLNQMRDFFPKAPSGFSAITPGGNGTSASVPYKPINPTVFSANHPEDEGVTSTFSERSQVPSPPRSGVLTTFLPGGGSVTTYAQGQHPSDAQIAGIPFRDAIPYGQQTQHVPTPINAGVGKIDGVDSDVANNRLSADLKARGILNPGSDAYRINDQINQAIREGRPFGNLLTQYDRASNRAAIPSADPNVVSNPNGTTNNAITGEVMTNNASAPVETPMQKLLNTPTNTPAEAREQARQMAAERLRLYNANPAQKAMDEWEAGNVKRHENYQNGISNASNPAVAADETRRRAGIAAQKDLEAANQLQPNGDPLHDAKIAQDRALAGAKMAKANGYTDDQIQDDPSIAMRYLGNPNGFNAKGTDRDMSRLVEQSLRGDPVEELVRSATFNNAGGTKQDRTYNAEATKQATSLEPIGYRDENVALRQKRLDDQERKADKKSQIESARAILPGLEKELSKAQELDRNSEEPETQALLRQVRSAQRVLASEFDKGDETEQTQPNNTPQPNQGMTKPKAEDLRPGQVINTPKGWMRWTGTGLVPVSNNG
jgi:hypothetical protein